MTDSIATWISLEMRGYTGYAGRKWVISTRSVKNFRVGLELRYRWSAATSLRSAIWLAAMSYASEFSLFSACATRSNAAFLSLACEPTDRTQPPDMLVLPGASPFCVGIAAVPSTVDHCGHGLLPVEIQVPLSHEPSRLMASLFCGSSSVDSFVPQLGSRASCGAGASFSEKIVLMKFSESVKPGLVVTHFFEPSS